MRRYKALTEDQLNRLRDIAADDISFNLKHGYNLLSRASKRELKIIAREFDARAKEAK